VPRRRRWCGIAKNIQNLAIAGIPVRITGQQVADVLARRRRVSAYRADPGASKL
jgi:hypothetical protein